MAGDQKNPPFPTQAQLEAMADSLTPARLEAMAAAFKRRERAEKKHPRPETPKLVEINKRNRERWVEFDKAFEERIKNHPEDVKYAVERHRQAILKRTPARDQDEMVDIVLGLPKRDLEAQARRGRLHTKRDDDAIDRVIDAGIQASKSAPEIWDMLIKAAEESDDLDTDSMKVGIILDKSGKWGRTVSKRSFGSIVSRRRTELQRRAGK